MKKIASCRYPSGQNADFIFDSQYTFTQIKAELLPEELYVVNTFTISNNEYRELLKGQDYCGCGYGDAKFGLHPLGVGNCCRKIVSKEREPHSFRKKRLIPSIHHTPIDVCTVDGQTITVYTLLHQRGYSKHVSGHWSMPKDEESIDSLSSTAHY